MCLENKPHAVEKFLRVNSKRKNITLWKVLKKESKLAPENNYCSQFGFYKKIYTGKLIGPYQHTEYKVGYNKSNSEATKPCMSRKQISRGIHVCLTKESARNHSGTDKRIVLVVCRIEDLIGVDSHADEAVFKGVRLSRKEYAKALA